MLLLLLQPHLLSTLTAQVHIAFDLSSYPYYSFSFLCDLRIDTLEAERSHVSLALALLLMPLVHPSPDRPCPRYEKLFMIECMNRTLRPIKDKALRVVKLPPGFPKSPYMTHALPVPWGVIKRGEASIWEMPAYRTLAQTLLNTLQTASSFVTNADTLQTQDLRSADHMTSASSLSPEKEEATPTKQASVCSLMKQEKRDELKTPAKLTPAKKLTRRRFGVKSGADIDVLADYEGASGAMESVNPDATFPSEVRRDEKHQFSSTEDAGSSCSALTQPPYSTPRRPTLSQIAGLPSSPPSSGAPDLFEELVKSSARDASVSGQQEVLEKNEHVGKELPIEGQIVTDGEQQGQRDESPGKTVEGLPPRSENQGSAAEDPVQDSQILYDQWKEAAWSEQVGKEHTHPRSPALFDLHGAGKSTSNMLPAVSDVVDGISTSLNELSTEDSAIDNQNVYHAAPPATARTIQKKPSIGASEYLSAEELAKKTSSNKRKHGSGEDPTHSTPISHHSEASCLDSARRPAMPSGDSDLHSSRTLTSKRPRREASKRAVQKIHNSFAPVLAKRPPPSSSRSVLTKNTCPAPISKRTVSFELPFVPPSKVYFRPVALQRRTRGLQGGADVEQDASSHFEEEIGPADPSQTPSPASPMPRLVDSSLADTHRGTCSFANALEVLAGVAGEQEYLPVPPLSEADANKIAVRQRSRRARSVNSMAQGNEKGTATRDCSADLYGGIQATDNLGEIHTGASILVSFRNPAAANHGFESYRATSEMSAHELMEDGEEGGSESGDEIDEPDTAQLEKPPWDLGQNSHAPVPDDRRNLVRPKRRITISSSSPEPEEAQSFPSLSPNAHGIPDAFEPHDQATLGVQQPEVVDAITADPKATNSMQCDEAFATEPELVFEAGDSDFAEEEDGEEPLATPERFKYDKDGKRLAGGKRRAGYEEDSDNDTMAQDDEAETHSATESDSSSEATMSPTIRLWSSLEEFDKEKRLQADMRAIVLDEDDELPESPVRIPTEVPRSSQKIQPLLVAPPAALFQPDLFDEDVFELPPPLRARLAPASPLHERTQRRVLRDESYVIAPYTILNTRGAYFDGLQNMEEAKEEDDQRRGRGTSEGRGSVTFRQPSQRPSTSSSTTAQHLGSHKKGSMTAPPVSSVDVPVVGRIKSRESEFNEDLEVDDARAR